MTFRQLELTRPVVSTKSDDIGTRKMTKSQVFWRNTGHPVIAVLYPQCGRTDAGFVQFTLIKIGKGGVANSGGGKINIVASNFGTGHGQVKTEKLAQRSPQAVTRNQ